MKTLRTIVLTLLIAAGMALAYVYSGTFDVAADQPDSALAGWLARTTRHYSIEARAKDIDVPDLAAPALIAEGAGEYAEMCAGCHLGPGVPDNEFRKGLNPPAPELAEREHAHGDARDVAAQFWIVKHGIKMTAMPAWGLTHDDAVLWSIIAFLRKLPELTPEQYAAMTAGAAAVHEQNEHAEHDQ